MTLWLGKNSVTRTVAFIFVCNYLNAACHLKSEIIIEICSTDVRRGHTYISLAQISGKAVKTQTGLV